MAKKTMDAASILAQFSAEKEEEFIPTGYRTLDKVLGGGISKGAMYLFWGPQGCGKSTMAIQIAKVFLKQNLGKVAYIDVEKALNRAQQEAFGIRDYVDQGTFLHLTCSSYVEADKITSALSTMDDIALVIVDSESMLLPKLGDDCQVNDNQPGQKSRQSNVWLTKVKSQFFEAGIASIVLAHARADLSFNMHGPSEKVAGGFSLKHIPDLLLKISIGQKLGEKGDLDGQVLHLVAEKNKFTKPFVNYDVKLFYGIGIKKSVDLIDLALSTGIIQVTSPGYFQLPDGTTIRGTQNIYNLTQEQLRDLAQHIS